MITEARGFACYASQFDKAVQYEMCSSDHIRFYCVRFAGTRGPTTAYPSEIAPAV